MQWREVALSSELFLQSWKNCSRSLLPWNTKDFRDAREGALLFQAGRPRIGIRFLKRLSILQVTTMPDVKRDYLVSSDKKRLAKPSE